MDSYNFDTIVKISAEFLTDSVEFLKLAWQQPNAPALLGAAAGVFILLIIIRKIRRHRRPVKLFDNRSGVVEVSYKALDELVQSVCYSLGATNRPDVNITTRRGRLCMSVSLKLESGQRLTDATSEIQTALTNACREHLGIEKLGRIDVRVTGFKGLIYKPTTKFLPPVKDTEDNIILDDENVFNFGDDPKRNSKDS